MPYFEHHGARLFYQERGEGHPLVFLHGAAWDMGQWNNQVDTFAARYRVITLDARGHGRSSLPPGEVFPDLFWKDLLALLDFLDIPCAVLCGLSMGGHVALQAAIHRQERVAGLILIGTPCTNRFNAYERMVVPVNRFCQRMMPMSWIAWCASAVLGGENLAARHYIRHVMENMDHDAYNRVWRAITSMESRNGLAGIVCPTLILIGDRDGLTGRQQAFLHSQIADARLTTVEHAHHGTVFDNPEQVNREIGLFLREVNW